MTYNEFVQQTSIATFPNTMGKYSTIDADAKAAIVFAQTLADELVKRGLLEPAKPVEAAPAKFTEADIVAGAVFKDEDGYIRTVTATGNNVVEYVRQQESYGDSIKISIESFVAMLKNANAIRIA